MDRLNDEIEKDPPKTIEELSASLRGVESLIEDMKRKGERGAFLESMLKLKADREKKITALTAEQPEEPVIDAEMARQLLCQFPEAWECDSYSPSPEEEEVAA